MKTPMFNSRFINVIGLEGNQSSVNRVITTVVGHPFYCSSGQNSTLPSTWFPFAGFAETQALGAPQGWIVKAGYVSDSTQEQKQLSLLEQNLRNNTKLPEMAMRFGVVDENGAIDAMLQRFGGIDGICISYLIGGGFWNLPLGQYVGNVLESQYSGFLNELRSVITAHFKNQSEQYNSDMSNISDVRTKQFEMVQLNIWLLDKLNQNAKSHKRIHLKDASGNGQEQLTMVVPIGYGPSAQVSYHALYEKYELKSKQQLNTGRDKEEVIKGLFVTYDSPEGQRLMTVVQNYPFYRSTGTFSHMNGTWLPFHGILEAKYFAVAIAGGQQGYIIKPSLNIPKNVLSIFKSAGMDCTNDFAQKTMSRFGSIDTLCISYLIGGGYWQTDNGKKVGDVLEKTYGNFLPAIRKEVKPHFEKLPENETTLLIIKHGDQPRLKQLNEWLGKPSGTTRQIFEGKDYAAGLNPLPSGYIESELARSALTLIALENGSPVTRLIIPVAHLAGYRTSGTNSGADGTWLPFEGLVNADQANLYVPLGYMSKPGAQTTEAWRGLYRFLYDQLNTVDFWRTSGNKYRLSNFLERFGGIDGICISLLMGGGIWSDDHPDKKVMKVCAEHIQKIYSATLDLLRPFVLQAQQNAQPETTVDLTKEPILTTLDEKKNEWPEYVGNEPDNNMTHYKLPGLVYSHEVDKVFRNMNSWLSQKTGSNYEQPEKPGSTPINYQRVYESALAQASPQPAAPTNYQGTQAVAIDAPDYVKICKDICDEYGRRDVVNPNRFQFDNDSINSNWIQFLKTGGNPPAVQPKGDLAAIMEKRGVVQNGWVKSDFNEAVRQMFMGQPIARNASEKGMT